MSQEIYTALGVFIAGICTYEYSMWRTKRYIKKIVERELPKIMPKVVQSLINMPKTGLTTEKGEMIDDYAA